MRQKARQFVFGMWLIPVFCYSPAATQSVTAWSGMFCELKIATAYLILNQGDWEKTWLKVQNSTPPQIDFEKNSIAAVFLGQRPTAGYSVKIKEIKEKPKEVHIIFGEKKPAKDRMVAQVLTQPYLIKIVPKLNPRKKVVFHSF